MSDFGRGLPRERLDALNGWKALRSARADDGLVPEGAVLHLARAKPGPDGALIFARPIADTDPAGSWGGRALPRGVAVSDVGDLYLAQLDAGRVLYTRASLPPVAEAQSPVAPFVPLWQFAEGPQPDHPLALHQPVDLCIVPASAAPGGFGDTLVVADAARNLLIWIDRRQIVVRHTLRLPDTPRAIAVAADGQVAVVMPGQVALITRGQIRHLTPTRADVHSIIALSYGGFAVVSQSDTQHLLPNGRLAEAPDGAVLTPAMQINDGRLVLPGACAEAAPLIYDHLRPDRFGALPGAGLTLVTRPRRLPRPRAGHWISRPFDGGGQGFAWDRVAMELDVPAQCRLLVRTLVSDTLFAAEGLETLPLWSDPMEFETATSPEFLIQRNKGRYLWLRIEAYGDGIETPTLHGIDLFGPRDSLIALLPAPFHHDPISQDFLDRFLSLQDAFYGEALQSFARIGTILDPEATPAEFIDWLGGWFDWRFMAGWDIATRREMITASMAFFAERGTVCGLLRILRWHTGLNGALPCVIEEFRIGADPALRATSEFWIGGQQVPLTDDPAHRFLVILPGTVVPDPSARAVIENLIAAQKPAHTVMRLAVVAPGFVPGQQGRLGVDAILPDSRPPPLGGGALGADLVTVAQR